MTCAAGIDCIAKHLEESNISSDNYHIGWARQQKMIRTSSAIDDRFIRSMC